ncbi:MAG: nitroreductase family protein [Nitrospirae bacterium]|nr:nitroreductase family protein [Nitrospirota bacterium]
MNPVIEAIKKRRSVRSYDPKPIPKDIMNAIIEAGNQAPSAMNSQPWRFVVVEDKALKKKLLNAALPNAKKILEHVKDSDPERYKTIMKRYEEMEDPIYYSAPSILFVIGSGRYADHSCPLACENIMLSAYSLGIGSCWVGFGSMVTDNADVIKALELKDDEKIFGPILLGYPKAHTEPPQKREPAVKWI